MDLILLVCLASAPATCREERVPLVEPGACIIASIPVVANWSADHPDWQVAKWTCAPGGRR